MEEVDQIIIHSLKGFVDIDEEMKSLAELTPELTVAAVVACLKVIGVKGEIPTTLPRKMSERVQACATLAQAVKDLGFKQDLGYHQLLYPNENTSRAILSFLTSKLPKDIDESAGKGPVADSFMTAVVAQMKLERKEVWNPFFGVTTKNRRNYEKVVHLKTWPVETPFLSLNAQQSREQAKKIIDNFREKQPLVTRQVPVRQDVVPSILEHNFATFTEAKDLEEEWNEVGLNSGLNKWQFRNRKKANLTKQMAEHIRYSMAESDAAFAKSYAEMVERQKAAQKAMMASKASRFQNLVEYAHEEVIAVNPAIKEEEIKKQREEELAKLQARLNELRDRIEAVKRDIETMKTTITQLEAQIIQEQSKFKDLEDEYRIQKKIFVELLPDAENNIRMLQEISQQSAKMLMELANEWEQHRGAMIEVYRKLKESKVGKPDDAKRMLEDIKKMREEMGQLRVEIDKKDERFKELNDEFSRLPKNINRSIYTKRILDIVKQVKKQKVDISKILLDTRNLKKEITIHMDALNRSFALTSEVVYQDAHKDPVAKQTYKDLVHMHDSFQELANKIKEGGDTKNATLDLEEKLQQLTKRAGSLDVERVQTDLQQMRDENKELLERLKSGKGAGDPLGAQ